MEGKKIKKQVDLGEDYSLIQFEDGEIAFVRIITPDGLSEDLKEFLSGVLEKPTKGEPAKEKPAKEKPAKEETAAETEESYTWDDLMDMVHSDLSELCEEGELDTDPDDYEEDEVDEFRKAVAKEIGVEIPEPKEEESEAKEGDENGTDDEYTWADLVEMDFEELQDLCEEEDLEVELDDYDEEDEDKLRRAIAKELEIAPPKKKKKK